VPKSVLLADDSVTIQRVVALTLANEDLTITSVSDGNQAVEAIRRATPDLVLADIGMPGRTGYEVAEYVRSQPELKSLPVLLLAGAFEPVDEAEARKVGADGVLTKPFEPSVLIGQVNLLLMKGRGYAVRPEPVAPVKPSVLHVEVPAAPMDTIVQPSRPVPPPAPPVPPPARPSTSDNYFDQIDQAFAALSKTPRAPLSLVVKNPVDEPAVAEETAGKEAPLATPDIVTSRSVSLPEAFTALLEAERTGVVNTALRLTPAPVPPPPSPPAAAAGVDIDAIASQITRRVLEQLSDRVVRETVAEIVSKTAERIVREEIEQVKRHIT
jgi:CheY-like chemotaxis protein